MYFVGVLACFEAHAIRHSIAQSQEFRASFLAGVVQSFDARNKVGGTCGADELSFSAGRGDGEDHSVRKRTRRTCLGADYCVLRKLKLQGPHHEAMLKRKIATTAGIVFGTALSGAHARLREREDMLLGQRPKEPRKSTDSS